MREFSKISNTENAIITAEKGGSLIIVSRIIIIFNTQIQPYITDSE